MGTEDCGCGKPSPGPVGGKPRPGLVASAGSTGVTHVAPNGTRTTGLDMLAARAAVVREGGSIEG